MFGICGVEVSVMHRYRYILLAQYTDLRLALVEASEDQIGGVAGRAGPYSASGPPECSGLGIPSGP